MLSAIHSLQCASAEFLKSNSVINRAEFLRCQIELFLSLATLVRLDFRQLFVYISLNDDKRFHECNAKLNNLFNVLNELWGWYFKIRPGSVALFSVCRHFTRV